VTTGVIFDIKRFAIHDGPGLRTTVFLKGCPLSCWACHNPEGQSCAPDLLVRPDRCNSCGDCVEVCRFDAVRLNGTAVLISRDTCDVCGVCADACLPGALEVAGRDVTVSELMAEVARDTVYYDESGGGVTFSGGEPLAQPAFLDAVLGECRHRNIATAVDTSGFAPQPVFQSIADRTDLFLYDLKLMDDERHHEFAGVSNDPIKRNLDWLSQEGRPVTIRFPLLPGVNDDPANVRALGAYVSHLPTPYPIDVLPYHRIGIDKYSRLGRAYRMPEPESSNDDRIAETVDLLVRFGLSVTVKGEPYGHE